MASGKHASALVPEVDDVGMISPEIMAAMDGLLYIKTR